MMGPHSSRKRSRVLVVSAPVGSGHIIAAQRVTDTLRRVMPADSTIIIDDIGSMLRIGPWAMTPVIDSAYGLGTSMFRGVPHRVAYSLVDNCPSFTEHAFRATFGPQLRKRVLAANPDVVISTFHVVSATLSQLLPSYIPVISAIPGAGRVNSLWLYGRIAHLIFPEPQGAGFAHDMGVPASRISTIADIFDPETTNVPSMDQARRDLKLPRQFTVLLSFGSNGFGRIGKEFLRLLRTTDLSTQIIITPGRKRASLAAARACADESTLVVPGWAPLMPYMAAANLVVGKAGWLTLTDASAMRRPTLILDYIKGQEDENVRIACLSGIARQLTPAQAANCVRQYSQDEAAMSRDFPLVNSTPRSSDGSGARIVDIVQHVTPSRFA
jgi:processive 1,2-diacylglycerol beta-glucosyltransferase